MNEDDKKLPRDVRRKLSLTVLTLPPNWLYPDWCTHPSSLSCSQTFHFKQFQYHTEPTYPKSPIWREKASGSVDKNPFNRWLAMGIYSWGKSQRVPFTNLWRFLCSRVIGEFAQKLLQVSRTKSSRFFLAAFWEWPGLLENPVSKIFRWSKEMGQQLRALAGFAVSLPSTSHQATRNSL